MKRNQVALAFLGALFLSGCYIVINPERVTNFLSGGNKLLADAIKGAAANWAWHGLEIANYVTVDDGRAGIPVRFVPRSELEKACPGNIPNLAGCTYSELGEWSGMLLLDDLVNRPERLLYIVAHEMIHALVPNAPHLENADGVFTPNRTVNHITRADMAHLARYTRVTPSQAPFFGEETAT